MKKAEIHTSSLAVSLRRGPDIIDITEDIDDIVQRSGIRTGVISATMIGSTGSLTTIEYEHGVVQDLIRAINQLAPPEAEYEHEKAWHDGNGHSHVQAALMGPSISLAIRHGKAKLGTWQQVVAVNHDNRSRRRTIEITICGTAED